MTFTHSDTCCDRWAAGHPAEAAAGAAWAARLAERDAAETGREAAA
jgi:hypothetical protein